eukprot:CAMPEP_0201491598 /NCGR_PEP_ID=MMETSP0151_2-20130828/30419_1 /ASSEMBLY_ACC=CAM_ASM_000257 /TAXON_ID=200890 /ORGANISM="Paramoeba atlantica, Strain 621/1 / CCAP 1560/9" /LENGTH=189 /DNA_ID=CAMNT_0047878021 /DNA_START=27 /DNA_END=596 /DNA_ORIENTATION=+
MAEEAQKTALVPVANGTEEIEAVSIIDTLRRAGIQVTVASVAEKTVTCSRGCVLVADTLIGECSGKQFDVIALPGGMPGAVHLKENDELKELLVEQAKSGRIYSAICASPAVVLHGHGLLQDKKATSHPGFHKDLPDKSSVEQRVVVDGNCVTSQGPGTAIEFALVLIDKLLGEEKKDQVGKPMVVAGL